MFKSWDIYIVCFKQSKNAPYVHIAFTRKKRAIKAAKVLCETGNVGEAEVKLTTAKNEGKFFAAWKNIGGKAIRNWRPLLVCYNNLDLYREWYKTEPQKEDAEYKKEGQQIFDPEDFKNITLEDFN